MSSVDSRHDAPSNQASNDLNPVFMFLGYLGLLPFLWCLLVVFSEKYKFVDLPNNTFGVDAQLFFVTYSLAILSFLAGTLWQQQFFSPEGSSQNLVLSNVVVVVAWVGLIAALGSKTWIEISLATNMLGFLFLLARERKTMIFDQRYRKMRYRLTCFVSLIHFLLLMLLISSF